MRYNKLLRAALPVLAASWLMASCTFEQEDYFDESAALRIEKANDDIQSILVAGSAEGQHGWLIQYFVAGTDEHSFEGFNIFGRFYADGKVVLSGNHRYLRNGRANMYTEAVSSYQMLKDEGPIIAFNTWNDVLTVFVDPVDPIAAPAQIVSDGLGMMGDQNLVVTSFSDTLIEARGERYSSKVRFVKLDCEPQEYIAKTAAKKAEFCFEGSDDYYLVNGTDTMYLTGLNKGYFNVVDRIDDPLVSHFGNCVFTPEGFRLQTPMFAVDTLFQTFAISADRTCLLAKESGAKLIPLWDKNLTSTTELFNLTELSEAQKTIFDNLAFVISGINPQWTLLSVGIGQSTGGEYVNGLVCTIKTQAAKEKTIGMSIDKTRAGYGQLVLSKPSAFEYDINLGIVDDLTTADLKALMQQFAETLYGTYSVTPDDYFNPSSFTMKNVADGSTLNFYK